MKIKALMKTKEKRLTSWETSARMTADCLSEAVLPEENDTILVKCGQETAQVFMTGIEHSTKASFTNWG